MSSVHIRSYAKLNLFLKVLEKRKDNYHNIFTLFERIDLYDDINLASRDDGQIKIICDNPNLPCGKSNLAYQAASLLKKDLKINKGVEIRIKKRIPVASGLGGGSSNAAGVLIGLNRLWGLRLKRKKLISYGKKLGADVPFFLYATAFACGSGRGDLIKRAAIKSKFWHLLVVPRIGVATKSVYQRLTRAYRSNSLTKRLSGVRMLLLSLKKHNLALIKRALFNDLEAPALKVCPSLKKTKQRLSNIVSEEKILMSGSGPAMFIFVNARKEGERLFRKISRVKQWRSFLVRTV